MSRTEIEIRFAVISAIAGVLGYAIPYAFMTNLSQLAVDITGIDVGTLVDVLGWAMHTFGFILPQLLAVTTAFAVAWIGRPVWDVLLWFVTAGVLYMLGIMLVAAVTAGGPHSLASFGLRWFIPFVGLAVLGVVAGHLLGQLNYFKPRSTDTT